MPGVSTGKLNLKMEYAGLEKQVKCPVPPEGGEGTPSAESISTEPTPSRLKAVK